VIPIRTGLRHLTIHYTSARQTNKPITRLVNDTSSRPGLYNAPRLMSILFYTAPPSFFSFDCMLDKALSIYVQ
jgi:hypothetical protein